MEHSPSQETNSCSASQEIPRLLWNPKVHYRIHQSSPPITVLSQINPIQMLRSNFRKTHFNFNIVLPSTSRSSRDILSSGYPIKIVSACLICSIRARCPAHHIFLDFIALIKFREGYKILSSPPFSFLQSPVISLLNSNTLNLCSSLHVRDQVSHPYKTTGQISFIWIFTFLNSRREDKGFLTAC
jgi:hypothetical protein